jgi:hypothetical membrane protein
VSCYLQALCFFVSVVVLSHPPVRRCVEGWLLVVYLVSGLAFVAVGVIQRHDVPHHLMTALDYTLCGAAVLMPAVFLVRIAVTFWSPRNA